MTTKKLAPQILFEDTNYLILDKPAGMVVHDDGRTKEYSLCDWLAEHYPKLSTIGDVIVLSGGANEGKEVKRYGVVHRIDRETSGIVVVAKNEDTYNLLKNQFLNREVEKVYHAFVRGNMQESEGKIDRPIARSKKDFRLWSAQPGGRGEARDALTLYKVLKRSPEASFVEIMPKTGRTHQIRVHFKAINRPLIGDTLYGLQQKTILGFDRVALHARKITFTNPKGKEVEYEAPYPQDFEDALKSFGK